MDASSPDVTVSTVELVIPPNVVPIVVVPVARVVARPLEPAALLIVATVGSKEIQQSTCVVISCVEPSVYIPVAVNC